MVRLYSVLLFGILAIVYVTSDPTSCYHCTLLDLGKCNSPVDATEIGTQSCDDIDTLGYQNTTSKVVCYTVTATFVGIAMSERGCYYAEMEGKDLCTFFNETQANEPFTYDYTCTLCDTDGCNID